MALTARLTKLEYHKESNTLRLVGAAAGTWSGGESLQISPTFAHEKGGF